MHEILVVGLVATLTLHKLFLLIEIDEMEKLEMSKDIK